jgi:hypothetical protein
MFLAVLKFWLGYIVGGLLFTVMLALAMKGAELFAHSRRKRQRRLWEAKANVLWRAMLRFHERAAFQFCIVPMTGYRLQTKPSICNEILLPPSRQIISQN